MRAEGWILPVSAGEVRDAEARLAANPVDLPAELGDPDAILRRLDAAGATGQADAAPPARYQRLRRSLTAHRKYILSAAALLLVAAMVAVLARRGEPAFRELAMVTADRPRSPKRQAWRSGEAFTLRFVLSRPLHLYVLHFDGREIEWFFPYQAAGTEWSYLGHPDNHFPAGAEVTLPAPQFSSELRVEGASGSQEFFIGFGATQEVSAEDLRRLRGEFEEEARKALGSGLGPDGAASRVREVVRERYEASEVISYRIE
jgi:hypothetical protein